MLEESEPEPEKVEVKRVSPRVKVAEQDTSWLDLKDKVKKEEVQPEFKKQG